MGPLVVNWREPQQRAQESKPSRSDLLVLGAFYEKAICAPIWQLGFLTGAGPRVGEPAFGLIRASPI
ncbi:MAG: hypothetical protein WA633_14130, partial [Stellaceae bacterium]